MSFTDSTFQDFVSHLASKPAEVEFLSKTLGNEDGKEPVGTFRALGTSALRFWSRSSNLERRRTLLPSLEDSEGCATPFVVSKKLCCSPHLRPLPAQPLPQRQNTARQSPKSQSPCRGVKASTSQRVWVCPMPRNFGQPTSPSSRAVHRVKARHACPSGCLLPRMGDAWRRRSVAKLLTNLLTARSPLNSCWVLWVYCVPLPSLRLQQGDTFTKVKNLLSCQLKR